jgi:hypothetical protein
VVELDASNDAKWSRHLIVRLPEHAFASNADVKRLVKQHILQHELMVTSEVAKSIVDDAVYTSYAPFAPCTQMECLSVLFRLTMHAGKIVPIDASLDWYACRNRAFRCLFSSKCMEDRPFRASGRFPPNFKSLPRYHQWLLSLVGLVQPSSKLLTIEEAPQQTGIAAYTSAAAPKYAQPVQSSPAPNNTHDGVRFSNVQVLTSLPSRQCNMHALVMAGFFPGNCVVYCDGLGMSDICMQHVPAVSSCRNDLSQSGRI